MLVPQHRIGRDGDGADFEQSEERNDEFRLVSQPKQHAVSGNDAKAAKRIAEAIHIPVDLGIGKDTLFKIEGGTLRMSRRDGAVQQLDRRVETSGIMEFR